MITMKPRLLLLVLLATVSSSCRACRSPEADERRIQLVNLTEFPEAVRPAIDAVIAELRRRGEVPDDFSARVERGDRVVGKYFPWKALDGGGYSFGNDPQPYYAAGPVPQPHVLVAHLWHRTASLPLREHRSNDAGIDISGLDMHFDTVKKIVTQVGFWQ